MIFKIIICAIALHTLNFSVEAAQSGGHQKTELDKTNINAMFDAIETGSKKKFNEALESCTAIDYDDVFELYAIAKSKPELEIANVIRASEKLRPFFTPQGYKKFFIEMADYDSAKLVEIALEMPINFPQFNQALDQETMNTVMNMAIKNNNTEILELLFKPHQGVPTPSSNDLLMAIWKKLMDLNNKIIDLDVRKSDKRY